MPTAAKLMAAILYAGLAWFAADLVKPHLPEATRVGLFSPVAACFGVLLGWVFAGRRIGAGQGGAVGIGISGAFLTFFWVLFYFSLHEMLRRSLRKVYHDPAEALQAMVEIAIVYLRAAAVPEVLLVVFLGGALVGWVTRAAARRWS